MNIHFIAIGGSVMHQLAISLKKKGYEVTGSDDEIFEPARSNLEKEGICPPSVGWHPDRIRAGLDAVILGMHAKQDNPELQRARSLDLKIYSFPEYIYEESKDKTRVVVGGSHGKTTTTSMIMHVLQDAGRNFDYLVGAKLPGFANSVRISNAPLIICEGDEYPASALEKIPKFLFLRPHIAIITGIAWDHINVFPTFDIYLEQFRLFIQSIEPGGTLIYNKTDVMLQSIVSQHAESIRLVPYGIPPHQITDGRTIVEIGGQTGKLEVFGEHNLLNLQAAWLAVNALGIEAETFVRAIGSFTGASKRLELVFSGPSTTIYRDFAHAPSKVMATIKAVRQQFPGRRLIALLELHTYSSLNPDFMVQYRGVMDGADDAAVFYSAHALEIKKMPELPAETVKEGFQKEGLTVINNKDELAKWLEGRVYKNATLLLMSSGNYDGMDLSSIARDIVERES
ncbi:MAG TPA: Mur ligase family protein [Puia sp.]|nr:Mur ligase family protein [Puia sp.]